MKTKHFSLHISFFNALSLSLRMFTINSDAVQQRPERLISRLRTISMEDTGPKLTVVRQPKGPDGTRGFNQERCRHIPGAIEE